MLYLVQVQYDMKAGNLNMELFIIIFLEGEGGGRREE